MIILGLYDKTNKAYEKFFPVMDSEINIFVKQLKIEFSKFDSVYNKFAKDYEIHKICILSDKGLQVPDTIELVASGIDLVMKGQKNEKI